MLNVIEKLFKLSKFKTNIRTEALAGVTTFMAMAYILAVQPNFMKAAGMDTGAVFTATALIAGISSIAMGLYTNLPFALAPGMGTNAVFAFTLVAGGITTWQVGLGTMFFSGTLFLIFTVLGLREIVVKAIPKSIKLGIAGAVGIFIASLGLNTSGLTLIHSGSLKLGDFTDVKVILSAFTMLTAAALIGRKVKGALFITLALSTVIALFLGITHLPEKISFVPPSMAPIFMKFDLIGIFKLSLLPYIFIFFISDFFSTLGTVLGVASKADLLDENGNLPEIKKPFLIDACATIAGAASGLTVVTTFVESSAGVEEGGRTGLTAVFTGIMFLLALFISPFALMIPPQATGPILVVIGISIFSGVAKLDFNDWEESFPAILTIFFTAFAGGLGNGFIVGILSYTLIKVLMGKFREVPIAMYIICIPLILTFFV